MKILSIQSSVAYGHVGNSAAVFPLQRLGHEVWPVLTVHFSNHTGYGAWRGPAPRARRRREVIAGHRRPRRAPPADAVLSGYQGDPAIGAVILDAVAQVKALNPAAVYCCDPVIGDVGRGCSCDPGSRSSSATRCCRRPTSSRPTTSSWTSSPAGDHDAAEEVLAAIDVLRSRGPRDVLVTSCCPDMPTRGSTWSPCPTTAPGR